jgi:hypothetical protein
MLHELASVILTHRTARTAMVFTSPKMVVVHHEKSEVLHGVHMV